ncbi:unnamed protein product [Closterium sp. NIES-53]
MQTIWLACCYSPPVRHQPAPPRHLRPFPHSLFPPFSPYHPTYCTTGLLSAVQTTWLAATLLQCAIGRPRPSFLTACLQGTQPVVSPSAGVTCVPPPAALYYFSKSFPSAHAAVSFSAAVFLLLFLSRTIQRSFPQQPSPLDSPSYRPSHRHNHSPQHRTQSHQECNQPLQHPHQSHQSPEHPNANATSSPHNLLVMATPSPHNNFTATRLWDSLRASHLWRVPAVAWPLVLAAGAGLADLDTYSNAPGDILAGVALGGWWFQSSVEGQGWVGLVDLGGGYEGM